MKSFNEWIEKKLYLEFDPNRGKEGRKVPYAMSGLPYQQVEQPSLTGPKRQERLKQIEDALRKHGPHYGGKYIQESELDDPIVQKLLDKYKYGRQGEDELVYTSGSGDKRNPQDVWQDNIKRAQRKIRTTQGQTNY